jgi:hypothetical protein
MHGAIRGIMAKKTEKTKVTLRNFTLKAALRYGYEFWVVNKRYTKKLKEE